MGAGRTGSQPRPLRLLRPTAAAEHPAGRDGVAPVGERPRGNHRHRDHDDRPPPPRPGDGQLHSDADADRHAHRGELKTATVSAAHADDIGVPGMPVEDAQATRPHRTGSIRLMGNPHSEICQPIPSDSTSTAASTPVKVAQSAAW